MSSMKKKSPKFVLCGLQISVFQFYWKKIFLCAHTHFDRFWGFIWHNSFSSDPNFIDLPCKISREAEWKFLDRLKGQHSDFFLLSYKILPFQ